MNIAQVVKKCAMEAFVASVPCDVCFGVVVGCEPMEIKVGQLTLKGDIIKVCEHLKYKEIKINYGFGDRVAVINEGLKADDILVLLRKSGGESYIAVGKI